MREIDSAFSSFLCLEFIYFRNPPHQLSEVLPAPLKHLSSLSYRRLLGVEYQTAKNLMPSECKTVLVHRQPGLNILSSLSAITVSIPPFWKHAFH